MISLSSLVAWVLCASVAASAPYNKRLRQPVAEAMAAEALAAAGDNEALARVLAADEVSLAWREGSNELDPRGSNDGGASACWAQVYLPGGARTREGWSAAELRSDARKCAHVAVRLILASMAASPACDACELTVYARGRDTAEGRRLSRARVLLARRLLREVPWAP